MKKIIFLIILLLMTGCAKKEYSTNLFYMDTVINIKITTAKAKEVNKAFEHIEKLYKKYELLTNYYDSNSELSKLNNGKKDIDNELLSLINIGNYWYDKSNGLLNVNIGSLTKLWHDFREKGILNKEDIYKISITKADLNNSVNIDLGSIAKGYVTQLAGEYLESINLDYYIINAGGNVKVGNSYKKNYKIGITSPIKDEVFEIIEANNVSVVTSGSYERFFEYEGKRYHHIIDPYTKYPADYFKSVTVIGKSSLECDALSTILFLMDLEKGKEFIKDYEVDVIWFTNEDKIIKSDGFKYE